MSGVTSPLLPPGSRLPGSSYNSMVPAIASPHLDIRAAAEATANVAAPAIQKAAAVFFNNQSTSLLRLRVAGESADGQDILPYVCRLHDNRIYAFEEGEGDDYVRPNPLLSSKPVNDSQRRLPSASETAAPSAAVPSGDRPDRLQSKDPPSVDAVAERVLLHMLTLPKYRVLSSLYFTFRLMDNLLLLSLAVNSIINGAFTEPGPGDVAILSAIGLELFYEVLTFTSKYWFFDRLSIYIGLGLYAVYFAITGYRASKVTVPLFVWVVLVSRLVAYLLETWLDFAVDCEIHNDLVVLREYKPSSLKRKETLEGWLSRARTKLDVCCLSRARAQLDVLHAFREEPWWPGPKCYLGSICAWHLGKSAYDRSQFITNKSTMHSWFRSAYIVPALALGGPLILLVALVAIPLALTWLCYKNSFLFPGKCRNRFLQELEESF